MILFNEDIQKKEKTGLKNETLPAGGDFCFLRKEIAREECFSKK
jgi:hypothetical protein